jgi:hypothetical protein
MGIPRAGFEPAISESEQPKFMRASDGRMAVRATSYAAKPGPYYPQGTIGTVPRAYDIFRPTKEWKGE